MATSEEVHALADRLAALENAYTQVQSQNQQLSAQLAQASAQVMSQQETTQAIASATQALTTAAQAIGTKGGSGSDGNLMELKSIGKPDIYNGDKAKWKDWKVVMLAYVAGVSPDLEVLMRHAESSASPVRSNTLDEPQKRLSKQLNYWLIQTCRGLALNQVLNAGENEGLEAWRLLVQHHEPNVPSRHAGRLLELMRWDLSGVIEDRLELFDREVNQFEQASGEDLSDTIKIGMILNNIAEGDLKRHLVFNAGRLDTWTLFRNEILEVRRVQQVSGSGTGAAPMDVSALGGKGGGNKNIKCWKCGKMGHRESECRSKGKDGGKGKTSSGQGGGKAIGKNSGPVCWQCGKTGHMAWECKSKGKCKDKGIGKGKGKGKKAGKSGKGAYSLDEQQWQHWDDSTWQQPGSAIPPPPAPYCAPGTQGQQPEQEPANLYGLDVCAIDRWEIGLDSEASVAHSGDLR